MTPRDVINNATKKELIDMLDQSICFVDIWCGMPHPDDCDGNCKRCMKEYKELHDRMSKMSAVRLRKWIFRFLCACIVPNAYTDCGRFPIVNNESNCGCWDLPLLKQ